MDRNDKDVEMRFLVPPHLVESVREAMALFLVEESACRHTFSGCKQGASHLTNQELDLLLRG